jgi:hypothetical protein
MTLTMSAESAQPACSLGGSNGDPEPRCQLPRVLLDCPGPPRFMPSFLLCPVNLRNDDVQGSNRIELGEAVDPMGNMRMADVPFAPDPYAPVDPNDLISKKNGFTGTAGCNECHGDANPNDPEGSPQLSDRIEADGGERGPCIISSDDCRVTVAPGNCSGKTQVMRETLSEICDCIHDARQNENHPLFAEGERLELLCRALEGYRTTRGGCATAGCPPASGPECHDVGADCDPATGNTVATQSGYKCQPVEEDVFQCVAECPCRAYELVGGGKFLVDGAVSMVRLQLGSTQATRDPDSIIDFLDISGDLEAFHYLDRTLIQSVSFSSFEAMRSGSDFSATGKGTALVNGSPTNIEFDVSQLGGVAMFEVRDADSAAFLAGGTGEDARAAFALTVTP